MNVIDSGKPTIRRRECNGTPSWQRRKSLAADGRLAADRRPADGQLAADERLAMDGRLGRSARSEARARNAVIDAYAMGAASSRARMSA
ncbi:MAG TPA: hypothetical protein VK680_09850 [Solirubrobacteraceae bacterium]|jgi:hypothetical protein|nr:hypothetical protein [Solirubrobacteraceae bacterium]